MKNTDASVLSSNEVRTVEYRVLGPLEVLADGVASALGGPKQRAVLAVLIASAGRPVSADALLHAIYGEEASPTSRSTLHTYVSNLRHVIGDVVVRQGAGYLLDCGGATIDALEFERACRNAAQAQDADGMSARLRVALSMWRGHPYADVEAHGFLDGELTRLNELRLAALEARIDADMRAGRHREVVAELDALTVEHPYRENLRGMHMLALYRSGRQVEALRAFDRTRVVLAEGVGLEPSQELKEIERRILDHDRSLLITVGPTLMSRRAVLVADLDDSGWSGPADREIAFARRESLLASAADREDALKLAPKGTAGYAVFAESIHAIEAARALVDERTRVAIDFGDLEIGDDEPVGPPLARAARLVAVAHPGQVLLSSAAHDALTATAEAGWAAASLGRFDIVGLDRGVHIYQVVGHGFSSDFPDLLVDRIPPPVPRGLERSLPGYELRALIGVGQIGEVHRAYQPSVGREVALRIFGPEMVGHPQFLRRFETASQRITRAEHPHLVPLLDYWREPNRAVMVSRLMAGGHLGQRIPSDGLETTEALAILDSVFSAIESAHRRGVVHGRIRPENVLFDGEGNAYVADLGVDEICAGVATFATNAYDAPERLGGVLATPAADVYSLGVLIHQVLGGSAPPSDGLLPLGDDAVALVVRRATDPDPRRRQASAAELAADLRHALSIGVDPTAEFVPARNPYRGLEAFEQADADDFHGRDRVIAEMIAILEREHLLVVVGPSGSGKSSVVKAGLVPALGRGGVTGSESWLVTEMVPGRSPLEQLASALGHVAVVALPDVVGELTNGGRSLDDIVRPLIPADTGLLVVVDQLEELFTETVDDGDRRVFLRMLVDAANRSETAVRLVTTLRADYFDRPLGYPGFGDAVRGRTVALGAMSASELADAVRAPAAGVGVGVEPALVERLTADAELQPGALPLVQHTMAELFAHRQTNIVTLAAFEEAGGLTGVIGRRAETIYLGFDDHTRDGARRVFLRLVNVSEDHEDTRRRVRSTELEQSGIGVGELDTVLREFGRHRLLTFDRDPSTRAPTVELAHEALLSEWARYRGWVEDARDDLLTRRRVETAARDWVNAGSEPSFLYGRGRLDLAESWEAASGFELTDVERRFLVASRDKVDRERRGHARRRRRIVGVLVAALAATTIMTGVALLQRRTADDRASETRARELAGEAQVAIEEDPERAVLLALAATEATDEPLPDAVSALQQAAQSVRTVATTDGVALDSFDQSADGLVIAVDRLDGPGYVLIDPADGTVLEEVRTDHQQGHDGLSFAPAGDWLAVAFAARDDGGPAVQLFEVPGGGVVRSLVGPPGTYDFPSHDASGRWLGAIYTDRDEVSEIVRWDVAAGGPPMSLGPATDFGFLPGTDSVLVLGREDTGLAVLDIETGQVVREIETNSEVEYHLMAVDATGDEVALTSLSGDRVDVLDLTTGELREEFEMPSPVETVFSADGRFLAVGGLDNVVRIVDTDTLAEMRLAGSPNQPWGIAFSPDGSRLVSAATGQVRHWDVAPEGRPSLGNLATSGGAPARLFVGADEPTALVSLHTADGRASLERVDMAGGTSDEVLTDLRVHDMAAPLVSPDLSVAAVLTSEYATEVVDLATGQATELARCEAVRAFDGSGDVAVIDGLMLCSNSNLPAALPGPGVASRVADLRTGRTVLDLGDTEVWTADFGPPLDDGSPRLVAVIENIPGTVTVHDLATATELGSFVPEEGFPLNLDIAPDGRRLAVTTESGQLTVVDLAALASGAAPEDAVAWTVDAHSGSVPGVSVSSAGWIATSSSAGNVRVWSADGQLVADLAVHPDGSSAVAFAPGTETLYYEDGNGVIRRFAVDPDETVRVARSLLTRGFTPDECIRYFPDERCPTFGE